MENTGRTSEQGDAGPDRVNPAPGQVDLPATNFDDFDKIPKSTSNIDDKFGTPSIEDNITDMSATELNLVDSELSNRLDQTQMSPEAREAADKLKDTLLAGGDTKDVSDLMHSMKDNPEAMREAVEALNQALKDEGSAVGLGMTGDGGLVMHSTDFSSTALVIGPDGSSTLRPVSKMDDGNILLGNGEVVNQNPEKVYDKLGFYMGANVLNSNRPPARPDKNQPAERPAPQQPTRPTESSNPSPGRSNAEERPREGQQRSGRDQISAVWNRNRNIA